MADTPARMRQLQATQADWDTTDPVLLDGEIGFASDIQRFKVGPGQWSSLPFWDDPNNPEDGKTYALQDNFWINASPYQDYSGDLNTLTPNDLVSHYRLVEPIDNKWTDASLTGNFITHFEYDSGTAVQVAYAYTPQDEGTNVIYNRVRRSGVWGRWITNTAYSPDQYVGDLNDLVSGGSFQIGLPLGNGVVNGWSTAGFGDVLQHTNINSTTALQLGYELVADNEPEIWMRTYASGVWTDWFENKFGLQVSESDIVDLDRVRWRNTWIGGQQYEVNDMVVSDGYLAVANTVTTDNPVPQSSGDPSYLLPTTPGWVTDTFVGAVQSGQQYTVQPGELYRVTKYRFWVPTGAAITDYKFALFLSDQTDPDNITNSIIAAFDGSQLQEGWNEYDALNEKLLGEGATFVVYLQSSNESSTNQVNVTGTYLRDANSNNAAPATGEWLTDLGNTELRINVQNAEGGDNSATLAGIVAGSDLSVIDDADGGANSYQNYRVLSVTNNGTWFEYAVVALDTGPSGAPGVGTVCSFSAAVPVVASTDYTFIVDQYAGNAGVAGLLRLGNGAMVESQNAFGVDLQFDVLTASPDWDIAAITSGGVGGSDGGGGSGGASVWYADNAPAEAVVGDLWYKTLDPVGLYVKTDDGTSTQFVQTNGATIDGDFVAKAGDVMTGNLTIPDAIADSHAASKGQVDSAITGFAVAKAGDVMTGALNIETDAAVSKLFLKVTDWTPGDGGPFVENTLRYLDQTGAETARVGHSGTNAGSFLVETNQSSMYLRAPDTVQLQAGGATQMIAWPDRIEIPEGYTLDIENSMAMRIGYGASAGLGYIEFHGDGGTGGRTAYIQGRSSGDVGLRLRDDVDGSQIDIGSNIGDITYSSANRHLFRTDGSGTSLVNMDGTKMTVNGNVEVAVGGAYTLDVRSTNAQGMRIGYNAGGSVGKYIGFYGTGTTSRTGYLQSSSDEMRIRNDASSVNWDFDSTGRLVAKGITANTSTDGAIVTPGRIQANGVYNTTTTAAANVAVNSLGLFSRSTSSAKYKTKVKKIGVTKSGPLIDKLKPVTFQFNPTLCEGEGDEHCVEPSQMLAGFIAEETNDALTALGVDAPDEENYDSRAVLALAVAEIQQLRKRLAKLEGK